MHQGGVVCLAGLQEWRLLDIPYGESPVLGARLHLRHRCPGLDAEEEDMEPNIPVHRTNRSLFLKGC